MASTPRQEIIPNMHVVQEPRLPFDSADYDVFAMQEELRLRKATDEEIAAFEQEFLPL